MEVKNWNFFVKMAILVFLLFAVITAIRLGIRISELESEVESAEDQVESLNNDIDSLFDQLDKPVDDDYIIRIARENLNYHLPDEKVYYNDSSR